MTTEPDKTPEESGPQPPKRKLNGRLFTKENAKAFSITANQAKKARAEMRRQLLKAAIDEGIDKYFVQAIKTGDEKLMNIVEKATKLVGLQHDQSEDAVANKLEVKADANVKTKHDGTINIVFKDAT